MAPRGKSTSDVSREMMNTREVAEYLRLKERKVYELVRKKQIPCSRVTGKWLFPRRLVDLWVARHTEYASLGGEPRVPPPVVVGSHDPLLEWAVRNSNCQLAMLPGGSLDGLKRLAAGEAVLAGLHVIDASTGEYNLHVIRQELRGEPIVVLRFAEREQGLLINERLQRSHRITCLADVANARARLVMRQASAGSQVLFYHLMTKEKLKLNSFVAGRYVALNETDLGLAIVEGRGDVGLGLRAVAEQYGLHFVPLQREQFDLVMRRRDYFEPPLQRLFTFVRSMDFLARSRNFAGYDVSARCTVVFNGD
jgi:excisionase family DNA binding protein